MVVAVGARERQESNSPPIAHLPFLPLPHHHAAAAKDRLAMVKVGEEEV